jgi:hypothetical protein
MSVFSDGCVTRRNNLKTTGVDPYYKIPAAVHSSKFITTKNTGGTCDPSDTQNVHHASVGFCNNQPRTGSNADLRGDRDSQGGALSASNSAHSGCFRYGASAYPGNGLATDDYLTDSSMDATKLRTSSATARAGSPAPSSTSCVLSPGGKATTGRRRRTPRPMVW